MEALLESRSSGSFKLDASLLDHLQTPRFMVLWQAEEPDVRQKNGRL